MPCYEVQTYSIEFKASNRALLDAAMKSLSWVPDSSGTEFVTLLGGGIVLNLKTGMATVQDGCREHLNTLKRAYSRQAIGAAARTNKWQLGTAEGVKNKGLLMRRVGA